MRTWDVSVPHGERRYGGAVARFSPDREVRRDVRRGARRHRSPVARGPRGVAVHRGDDGGGRRAKRGVRDPGRRDLPHATRPHESECPGRGPGFADQLRGDRRAGDERRKGSPPDVVADGHPLRPGRAGGLQRRTPQHGRAVGNNFSRPVLNVQVVGPSPAEVTATFEEVVRQIEQVAAARERAAGAPPTTWVSLRLSPAKPVIGYVPGGESGRRSRSALSAPRGRSSGPCTSTGGEHAGIDESPRCPSARDPDVDHHGPASNRLRLVATSARGRVAAIGSSTTHLWADAHPSGPYLP